MRVEPILTERLVVRELEPGDRAGLSGFLRDQDALSMMLFSLKDGAELDSFLSIAASGALNPDRDEYHCAIALRDSPSDCIGCVSLMGEGPGAREMEIGYFLLRERWGKGYTAEAARALVDFGFRSLGLHRVWGKCHERNPASAKVMEKLGMSPEGKLREHVWLRDHWRSSLLFGVLDREWEALARERRT